VSLMLLLLLVLLLLLLQVPLPVPPAASRPPVFVLGGEDDRVLDVQAYQELARCVRSNNALVQGKIIDSGRSYRRQVCSGQVHVAGCVNVGCRTLTRAAFSVGFFYNPGRAQVRGVFQAAWHSHWPVDIRRRPQALYGCMCGTHSACPSLYHSKERSIILCCIRVCTPTHIPSCLHLAAALLAPPPKKPHHPTVPTTRSLWCCRGWPMTSCWTHAGRQQRGHCKTGWTPHTEYGSLISSTEVAGHQSLRAACRTVS
jgi:hypothetical protein